MVTRALVLATALLGCQTILPLADGDASGGSGGASGDGGLSTDGFIDGIDPDLQAPLPDLKPGCAPDALQVEARIVSDTTYSFTRRAPIKISYAAPGAARVVFRSALPGRVNADPDAVEGELAYSFGNATDPIWAGTYHFTVIAFNAAGCSASARVDFTVAGDLLVGTRKGNVWYLSSQGQVLGQVDFALPAPSPISALAIRRDPERLMVGVDHPDGMELGTSVFEVDVASGMVTPFAFEDIQGDPLYRSGKAPDHFVWQPDGERVWADGVNDNALHVFFPDGRHDRTVEITDTGGLTTSVLGLWTDDGLIAASESTRKIFRVDAEDRSRAIVELESAFSKVRFLAEGSMAPNGEPTFLVLIWDGNLERVERFTVFGQYVDAVDVSGLSDQVLLSGDALLVRSTTGGITVWPLDGSESSRLFDTRSFTEATGEDFINLGSMIELK